MPLTTKDLSEIKKLIDSSIDANNTVLLKAIFNYIDQRLEQTEEKFSKQISHLPSKDEFYAMEDKLMHEVQAEREENTVLSHRITRLESFHDIAA